MVTYEVTLEDVETGEIVRVEIAVSPEPGYSGKREAMTSARIQAAKMNGKVPSAYRHVGEWIL